uniref:Uncharacterized protein n=1 Tax=Ceratitis capitata TaxID=7213 RepID=W8B8H9_CERCA
MNLCTYVYNIVCFPNKTFVKYIYFHKFAQKFLNSLVDYDSVGLVAEVLVPDSTAAAVAVDLVAQPRQQVDLAVVEVVANDDDDDGDDDVEEIKDECEDEENERDTEGNGEVAAKRRRLKASNATSSGTSNNKAQTPRGALSATGNTIVNRNNAGLSHSNSTHGLQNRSGLQPALNNLATPQLAPLRQLVALPLQGNVAGMPQKVLVATPITPAGQMSGSKPMTMTIIPLATIAQSQGMQAVAVSTAVTAAAAATAPAVAPALATQALTAALATATATAATPLSEAEKSTVPPPMLDIKKEVKQEPMEIKQEYISDDEEDVVVEKVQPPQQQKQQNQTTTPTTAATQQNARTNNKKGNNVFLSDVETSSNNSSDIDNSITAPESADDENIALANLRRLIQTQGKIVATSAQSSSSATVMRGNTATTTMSAIPPLEPKPIFTPIRLPLSKPTSVERQSLPASTNAITCIPAANITAMNRALCFTPPLPPLTKAPEAVINRLANKRKHTTSNTPQLPPIKSCSEARKYLKLLEDFALVKENFRLIGLITRADEVLRELDGDDDVDVD